jgi:hypothetical protein
LVLESDGTTFTQHGECDGSSNTVIAQLRCDIALTTLISGAGGLSLGDLVQAKIRAINAQGNGPYSQVNAVGGLVQTVPAQVQGLTFDSTQSSNTENRITWTELTSNTDTGLSAITGYEVQSATAGASPSWSTLSTVSAGTAFYVANGLTGGTTYLYRVRGQNLHGSGTYSAEISALAAQAPNKPDAPVVT